MRRYAVIVESRALGPYFTPVGPDGVSRRPTFRCNLNCRFALGGTRADVAVARRTPPGPLPPPRLRARSSPGALNPAKRPGLLARAVRPSSGACALLAAGPDSDPRPGCPRHQNSGRCSGAPTRRGKPSGQGVTLLRIANDLGDATTSASSSPSMPRGPAGQRSAPPPGGPDTTRTPAAPRKPAPHSAVAAGWPKLRATTAEKAPRSSGRCAAVSARSATTLTRSVQPSFLTAVSRKWARSIASVEQDRTAPWAAGLRGRGREGRRRYRGRGSRSRLSSLGQAARKPRAWATWSASGAGPIAPRDSAEASTPRRSSPGDHPTHRESAAS